RYLEHRARTMPVLVVSPILGSGPAVRPNELARSVAGLAHVYVLADAWCAELFSEVMGPRLGCRDGTVRLFWPGLRDVGSGECQAAWGAFYCSRERALFELDLMEALATGWDAQEATLPVEAPGEEVTEP